MKIYTVKLGHRIEVNGQIKTFKSAPFQLEDHKARKVALMIEEVVDKKALAATEKAEKEAAETAKKEAEAKAKAEEKAKAEAEEKAKAKADADANPKKNTNKKK